MTRLISVVDARERMCDHYSSGKFRTIPNELVEKINTEVETASTKGYSKCVVMLSHIGQITLDDLAHTLYNMGYRTETFLGGIHSRILISWHMDPNKRQI